MTPQSKSWIATLITGILAAISALIAPFALGAAAGSTAAAVIAGGSSGTGAGGGVSVMGAAIANGALKSAADMYGPYHILSCISQADYFEKCSTRT